MLKKLLVVSMLGLVLSGCSEGKKVTADMLIGKWECLMVDGYDKKYDSMGKLNRTYVFDDIPKTASIPLLIHNYEKENGLLILFVNYSDRSDPPTRIDMSKIKDLSNYEKNTKFNEYTSQESSSTKDYISDDKFKMTSYGIIKNTKNGFIIQEYKSVFDCSRVK